MTDPIPKQVLVVEDEPLVRMVAADALTDCGIMAWEAGDADEALHMLDRHPCIGLVFTDVDMPGSLNGLDLAHRVSSSRPDIELIVTSGAVTISDEQLPDHGIFLPKPYLTARLINLVAKKLDGNSD